MQRINDKITWIQPYYDLVLNLIPVDIESILDIGSGNGIFGFILKKTRQVYLAGIEPFEQDLHHYDYIINKKWQDASISDLGINQYDIVIALEMIEHLPRHDVIPFLKWCKSLAKKRVIIATPYKFEHQPAYDSNELQIHQSLVTTEDFEHERYNVYLFGTINMRLITIQFLANKRLESLINKIKIAKITNIIGVYDA